MPTAVESTPSHLRMFRSFEGLVDGGGGDTQPMDSQIYKNYTSATLDPSAEGYTVDAVQRLTGDDPGAPQTQNEGNTDHIDIVGNWERDVSKEPQSSLGPEDLSELSPETQFRIQPNISAAFIAPKTPATAAKKRDYHGELISSATRTPGSRLAAMFGGNGAGPAVLSLSQVFNATQAPSSPLPDTLRSDPVFQRPSPNFVTVRHSSPPVASSSPSRRVRSDPQRALMEPRETYITMDESQKLRERRERERKELEALQSEELDEFDAELTAEEQRAALRRKHAEVNSRALLECATLTAPNTGQRGRRVKRPIYISSDAAFTTPATARRKARNVVETSDGIAEVEKSSNLQTTEDGTGQQSIVKPVSNGHTNKGNGMQVPMTSSRPAVGLSGTSIIRNGDSPAEKLAGSVGSLVSTNKISPDGYRSGGTTRMVAVIDSQPELTQAQESIPVPQTLVEPSSVDINLRLAQSQLSSPSRNARLELPAAILDVLNTSSVPRPPPLTSQIERSEVQERMPSSPPLMVSADLEEEDEVIDEHQELDDEVDLVTTQDIEVEEAADDGPVTCESSGRGTPAITMQRQAPSDSTGRSIPDLPPFKSRHETVQSTIPETDPVETPASSDLRASARSKAASSASDAHHAENTGSETPRGAATGAFEAAHSRFSTSPQTRPMGQASGPEFGTPKHTRLRSLTDIASSPAVDDPIGDIDMDINLMTEADNDFAAAMSGSSPVQPSRKRRKVYKGRALREPVLEIAEPPSSTPPSAKKREERGALAAMQARQSPVFSKPATLKEGRLTRPTHKVVRDLGTANHVAVSTTTQANQAARRVSGVAKLPQPKLDNTPAITPSVEKAVQGGAQAPQSARTAPKASKPVTARAETTPVVSSTDDASARVPNRILALFKGGSMAYYPATCLGLSHADGLRFKVRFDDGTVDNLEPQHVRRLDLRAGDLIKVDLKDMRTKTYEVCGFKDRLAVTSVTATGQAQQDFPLTDRYGYRTVVLAVKRRDSLPAAKQGADQDKVEVPVSSIYLTSTMWSRFKDRAYTHPSEPSTLNLRLQTPSDYPSAPVTPTPKSKRLTAAAFHTRDSSATSPRQESTLFSGMAFAVTFAAHEDEKDQTIKLILDNGGRFLNDGFESLFYTDSPDPSSLASPAKSPTTATAPTNPSDAALPFRLTRSAEALGFTALIADRHSRRAKYMQALALGLPCVHPRWLRDCVAQARILDFAKYLLPAGESAFLGGAVRSRVLAPYPAATARFASVVEGRAKLLDGRSVVVVVGKGRVEERRRVYLFLARALGASRVEGVRSLEEARRVLGDGRAWDWVYVDGQEREAERVLFGGASGGGAGRKRRRRTGEEEVGDKEKERDVVKRVKLVGDETVIQSLILGALLEE